jgi:hypothetical protein
MNRVAYTLALAVALGTASPDDEFLSASQGPPRIQDPVLSAIAAAVEMPALENAILPPGHREIRVRIEQPMVCCDPRPMLRLVEGSGEVRGSLWLFRTLVLRPGNPAPRDDERCEPLGMQHVCVRPWNLSTASWASVAARLEQLGAWTLTQPCNRPTIIRREDGSTSISGGIVGDAGLLSVQRRVGSSTTAFLCIGPRYEREPDGQKANELYEYFVGLNGVIPSEPIRIAK